MYIFLLILGAVTLAAYIAAGVQVTLGTRRIVHLDNIEPAGNDAAPRISVVIPACNEERHIEKALSSVLNQDYPDYEVIAVDDRSADATGAILDRIAAKEPALRVVHIRDLPKGWLGKNHALHYGASLATGALILFTDADVVMERTVLRRAARYIEEQFLDHLAVPPRALVPGFAANTFLGLFAMLFTMYTKPWKVRDPAAKEHIGIGAFNLVRASAYRAIGGHGPIAMRPDDDLKLGKLMKIHGFKQDMVFGTQLMSVEWYGSFAEMRHGLMKNMFAGVEYNTAAMIGSVLAQIAVLVWPFAALFLTRGPVWVLNAGIVIVLCGLFAVHSRLVGIRWYWCFTIPAGALIAIYLMIRSLALTLGNDGINWRGTHYSLTDLRENKVDWKR